jgi:polar amino acid transport system substrate-binding protein
MKNYQLFRNIKFLLLFSIIVLLTVGCKEIKVGEGGQKESLYERVLSNGKIRASYASYPPYCIVDPNSGELSGIFVEVLEEIGNRLQLEIVWVEEVGWGTIFEGLKSGRHDMFGAGLWQNSSRGKHGYFSKPIFYNGIRIWVRSDEERIKTLEDINSPGIRMSVQDGAMDDVIANADFPNARKVSIPQLNPWSDNLLNTITNKTDVSLSELGPIADFLSKNPGTLKEIDIGRPLRVFANCYAFNIGENKFKSMIDAAIEELIFDGTIEQILTKHETTPGQFLRVAPPYEIPIEYNY